MSNLITTLFMLMSVDGKISTGASDELDFDKDFPHIKGMREGLQQYYDIEQTTDLWSLTSGRVQAKVGVNEKRLPEKTPVSFVLLDNHHLTEHGITYFCARAKQCILVTANNRHPAFQIQEDNLHILYYDTIKLADVLSQLHTDFGCERITIQTGGTLNSIFLREKLLDYVDLVVAPVLIGGKQTASVIDGEAITSVSELSRLGILELESITPLKASYLRLRYRVIS